MSENHNPLKPESRCPGFQPFTAWSCLCYCLCLSMVKLYKVLEKTVVKDSSYEPGWMNCIQIKQNLTWNSHHIDITRFWDLMVSYFVLTKFIINLKEQIAAAAFLRGSQFYGWYCVLQSWRADTLWFSHTNLLWDTFVFSQENFQWLKMFSFATVILCIKTQLS